MPVTESIGRRQCIPIVYTRGTHYEVGYDVGRACSGLIHGFLNQCKPLNDEFLPAYETAEGRKAYDDTLDCLKANYPQYVRELEGTADGAGVPFYKLFLLHMDDMVPTTKEVKRQESNGCSSICLNQEGEEILGHTEDALEDTLNNYYFVSAHIISDKPQGRWKATEEKFTSLCYAGHLPGYTMSYNHHGLIFSINTISVTDVRAGYTPRHFITRALLSAQNFVEAEQILRDPACGAGNGCSVNMTFLNQEGDRLFHNVEMAPADGREGSLLNILTASPGENLFHCNRYLRIEIPEENEVMVTSSIRRMDVFQKYPKPKTKQDVINMLGDQSDTDWPVFRDNPNDHVRTIAVGIFDCVEKTWSLYSDNPKKSAPLVVLPLVLKK